MLGSFTCARFRLVLEVLDPLSLSAFAGATLRGGFGQVFKQTVCIWKPADCPRCLLRHTCSYSYIFETAPPPGAEKLRNLDQIPRPYVIEPPLAPNSSPRATHYAPGDRFDFHLVLIGRAIDYLPYFVFTFQRLGEHGLGRNRSRYRLLEIHNEATASARRGSPDPAATPTECLPPAPRMIFDSTTGILDTRIDRLTFNGFPPPPSTRLAIRFLTPTRIKSDGQVCTDLSFQDLIRALLRRLSSLMYFHCGQELAVDFRALIEGAAAIRTVRSELRWHDQGRFSTRQYKSIESGGVLGEVEFEAPTNAWTVYWPLLMAGQCVHVGKGTVMGLGKYVTDSRA